MAMTYEQRSRAAKLGWERRKAKQAAEAARKAKRSQAAKKGWETRRKRQQAREMEEEFERYRQEMEQPEAAEYEGLMEAENIEMMLREILANGEGGEHLASVLIDALDNLKTEIGEDEYYKNLKDNAQLILSNAVKLVYKYEHEEKTSYAQAIYSAASGNKMMPDDIMIDVYDACNADRRAQYAERHPGSKSRGPYNKKR